MNVRLALPCSILALLAAGAALAQSAAEPSPEAALRELEAGLRFQQGRVTVAGEVASFELGSTFRYLDPAQSSKVLKAWGNPPDSETLGMVFPADRGPFDESAWAVVVTYEQDGYVNDEDAGKLDFAEMLTEMQKSTREGNAARKKAGYPEVELAGWAEPPHYDAASHKLYWAKSLRFGGEDEDTLNYNIRVLGRSGVLVLNAVAGVDQLEEVRAAMQELLPAVEFNPGHRYADYIPGKDKLAEYGIGALIAGTIAAKAGLFKMLFAGILAFKKILVFGVLAAGAAVKRFFKKKEPSVNDSVLPGT